MASYIAPRSTIFLRISHYYHFHDPTMGFQASILAPSMHLTISPIKNLDWSTFFRRLIFHCAEELEHEIKESSGKVSGRQKLTDWMKDYLVKVIEAIASRKEAWLLRSFLPANYSSFMYSEGRNIEQLASHNYDRGISTQKMNEMEHGMERILSDLLPRILQHIQESVTANDIEPELVATTIFLALAPRSPAFCAAQENRNNVLSCQDKLRDPQTLRKLLRVRKRALRQMPP